MRDVVRALLIAATLLLIPIPSRFGATASSYAVVTALLIAVNIVLVRSFAVPQPATRQRAHPIAALAAAAVAGLLVAIGARTWLHEILIYPHDAWRADMLVVIQEGIRRLLRGQNPYTMYHVPWDATLPYGPVMWLPYAVPFVMRIDVRFVSLVGEMFVPLACALTATAAASRGKYAAAVASLILLGAVALSPAVQNFSSIAHTPSYWPAIALFAWLVGRERWLSAAIVCGLLIVARTTMVSVAPVLMMAIWHRERRTTPVAFVLLTLAVLLPYLPFAIWDPAALRYALYGSYQLLMKGFVWTSTEWAHHTVGITGLLLRERLQAYTELVQALVMIATFGVAWRSIRAGTPPLPWMALALFAFSATTLWPVDYVYFDVTMMWIAAAIARGDWVEPRRIFPAWGVTLAASMAVIFLTVAATIRSNPSIDVGIGATRSLLYKGFSSNEGDERTFAWIDGSSAEILIPRKSRSDADIEFQIEPYLPTPQSTQQMSVVLNGVVLGTSELQDGWHAVTVRAPSAAWRIGVNELVLSLSSAVSPHDAGTGDDTRKLSAAIDRLTLRTTQ